MFIGTIHCVTFFLFFIINFYFTRIFHITFFYEKKFALKKRYLSRDESDFLFNYLSGLGRGDAESEKKNATFTESKLKDYVEKCEEEEKKYKPLLVKLGFLLGVVVFILII